jgi:hypothetical protein
MKKIALALSSLIVVGGMFFFTACTETDTTKPVVTVTSNTDAFNRVEQFSTTSYTDPGATASDDKDGVLTCTVTGAVNMNSAGEYNLTYTATDAEGNFGTADRTVTVDGGLFLNGTYTAVDWVGAVQTAGNYTEYITPSSTVWNKVNFTKFGFYQNAAVYGTIAGTTITIPSQTVYCGLVPNDKNHTFSGSGTFTNSSPFIFTITFHDSSTDGEYDCHEVYTLN